ncbi:hypothetical protein PSN45_001503 [Yamadazyma tenuis]|uniref:uncharacterized protein n=1 Tax=Candida tenuis TaxID=2315449 RepID=UPI0027A9CA78|nr:hypothetical protein PSN45_001503 [Yamadazyma tenuis]
MVAEPVQATLDTLGYFYGRASDFLSSQAEALQQIDFKQYDLRSDSTRNQFTRKSSLLDVIYKHKGKIGLLTVGIGIGAFYYYNQFQPAHKLGLKPAYNMPPKPKRRVPKLANGARQDVVLVVGSPTEPLTRLIALDFERRGFIVYLTILDEKDLKYIESNPITNDINYLNLTNSYSFESQLNKFNHLLQVPVVPFAGAEAHNLKLRAVVFTPNLYYPIGPIENITVASWTKITDRLSVYLKLFSSGLIQLIRLQESKTILITPSITSALNLPYHSPESLLQNALQGLFTTLSREIRQHNLQVTQVRLGNISVSSNSNTSLKTSSIINAEIKSWNEDIKLLYSRSFTKSQFRSSPIKSSGKGTNLRDLYHVLFDLIYPKKTNPQVVYCGTGSQIYDWISSLLPVSFVSWILT